MKARNLKRLMNLWPPFWGAGIAIDSISEDYQHCVVSMKLRWYNRNYVGTHFGGSLYAMTDPFYMLLIMHNLGSKYHVWDIAASMRFIKPGKGKVTASFSIDENLIKKIKADASQGEKVVYSLPVTVKNTEGEAVAEVNKDIYVRLKPRYRPS